MNRQQRLAVVEAAELRLQRARFRLEVASQPWRQRVRSPGLLPGLGISFLAGVAMARAPGRILARAVSMATGLTSLMLRTPLGSMMVAALSAARSSSRFTTGKSGS